MNRQAFLNLVENPKLLGENTLEGLASIVADYPYFQAARMLYVKNLSDVESIKYNSVLKVSAAYIANREQLYKLVYFTPKDHSDKSAFKEPVPQSIVSNNKNEGALKFSLSLDNEVLPSNPIIKSEPRALDYFEVSDEIDFSKIALKPAIPIIKIPTTVEKDALVGVPILNDYPAGDLLDFERENNSGYSLEKDHSASEIDESEGLSFSDWLIKMRQQNNASVVLESPKSDKMELINTFLKAKPKIVPRMVGFSGVDEAPKRVFEEPENLLTETLANIYIKQKFYSKSIHIFEKLRLKYPEKSVYFANRISEVEKLSNNNL